MPCAGGEVTGDPEAAVQEERERTKEVKRRARSEPPGRPGGHGSDPEQPAKKSAGWRAPSIASASICEAFRYLWRSSQSRSIVTASALI
jgi:hypothetical protein